MKTGRPLLGSGEAHGEMEMAMTSSAWSRLWLWSEQTDGCLQWGAVVPEKPEPRALRWQPVASHKRRGDRPRHRHSTFR